MTTVLKHPVQLDSYKDIIKVRFICQCGHDRSVGEKPIELVWGICNMHLGVRLEEAEEGVGKIRKILSTKVTASACSFLAKKT